MMTKSHPWQLPFVPEEEDEKTADKLSRVTQSKLKVSSKTHTAKEVAEDFLRWREELHKNQRGHNGGPPMTDDDE
jgi:hypothetical protein